MLTCVACAFDRGVGTVEWRVSHYSPPACGYASAWPICSAVIGDTTLHSSFAGGLVILGEAEQQGGRGPRATSNGGSQGGEHWRLISVMKPLESDLSPLQSADQASPGAGPKSDASTVCMPNDAARSIVTAQSHLTTCSTVERLQIWLLLKSAHNPGFCRADHSAT
jgi:hypothetical protein